MPVYLTPAQDLAPEGVELRDVLRVERLDDDLFRSTVEVNEPHHALYGGQVFAQALLAAGRTVPEGRLPHSAHGYFLRPGDSSVPVVLRVERDRDGRTLSARRVVAIQRGKVILNLSASFGVPLLDAAVELLEPMPQVQPPGELTASSRLVGIDVSLPEQPGPVVTYPTRAWFRCREELPDDPLLDLAVMAYVSDCYTGSGGLASSAGRRQPTIDHTVWFHAASPSGDWLLSDLQTRVVTNGRSFYTGSLWSPDGRLMASLAQETVYRDEA